MKKLLVFLLLLLVSSVVHGQDEVVPDRTIYAKSGEMAYKIDVADNGKIVSEIEIGNIGTDYVTASGLRYNVTTSQDKKVLYAQDITKTEQQNHFVLGADETTIVIDIAHGYTVNHDFFVILIDDWREEVSEGFSLVYIDYDGQKLHHRASVQLTDKFCYSLLVNSSSDVLVQCTDGLFLVENGLMTLVTDSSTTYAFCNGIPCYTVKSDEGYFINFVTSGESIGSDLLIESYIFEMQDDFVVYRSGHQYIVQNIKEQQTKFVIVGVNSIEIYDGWAYWTNDSVNGRELCAKYLDFDQSVPIVCSATKAEMLSGVTEFTE